MAICAHSTCTCEAADGSNFCSPWCEGNAEAEECHCHHAGCAAPHHH